MVSPLAFQIEIISMIAFSLSLLTVITKYISQENKELHDLLCIVLVCGQFGVGGL